MEGAFPSKPNVILFSRSDDGVNDDCYVHYYIQQQNTNRLGVILVYICTGGETTDDRSLRMGLR